MDSDVFINSNNQQKKSVANNNSNFFLQSGALGSTSQIPNSSKHLNDYDFNILKDDAYKEIGDELFILEYKIVSVENKIKDLDRDLTAAQNIKDYELIGSLQAQKLILEENLVELTKMYKQSGLSARISSSFNGKIKMYLTKFRKKLIDFITKYAVRFSHKFSHFVELKQSLRTLESINNSVDELISMKIPYGESFSKYDQLSKYIVRANTIQSEISKYSK